LALVRGEGISKSYGDNLLIEKVSFSINEKEKIGLIGRNGVGKTTFLRLISGEIEPEEGKIERKKNLQFGYLPQKVPLSSEKTLYEEVKEVFDEILKLEEKIDNLTTLMSREEGDISHYLKEFDKLQEEFEEKGGYIYEAKIKEVLFGLGFTEDKFKMKISDLSGGEKSRISYSKLLLKSSDLLLLDEPTNHLDIEAIEWLEGFLRDYDKAFVIVSHDRYFLDKVVEKVWEIEERKLKEYRGNYTSYIRKKAEILARREKEYNLQKKQISHLEEFIRRNIGGRAPTQAKSREKRLQKLKRVEKPQKEKEITFQFSPKNRGGDSVLKVSRLSKMLGNKYLFRDLNLELTRGDRVGIIGPNGVGKTTFLRIIMGREKPTEGRVKIGERIRLGYYDQHLLELEEENSVIEEVWKVSPDLEKKEIYSFLGKFLFSRKEAFTSISELSGGEKARVLLAKLVLAGINFLVMDEPTNHLDLYSRNILEEALEKYQGTILFVSHDRSFLDRIARKILYFYKGGRTKLYLGNYSSFLKKEEEKKILVC